ncbi:MAG: NAD-dependent epimerase/dehydratase family protein [Solirubrobacterales bacterium]
MSTTVLLTGEAGFLGRRVHASLDADPAIELSVLGRRLAELQPADLPEVDVVIHLAAWTPKRVGLTDSERIVDANVLGLRRLLSALDPPPRRFLFASTISVYGMQDGPHLNERSLLDPTDAYAASKLLGEHLVRADARARGYEASAVRIGHLYGPGEEAYEKIVPTMIGALMRGRPPTVVGDGQTRRDFLYVDDAAEAIRRLALSSRPLPEILNLTASGTHTVEEIARTLIEIVGFMGRIRYLSDQPRPPSLSFDTALLSEIAGDPDRTALAEGLRREVEHVVARERNSQRVPSGV